MWHPQRENAAMCEKAANCEKYQRVKIDAICEKLIINVKK